MILVLGPTGNTGGEGARQLIAAGQKPRRLVHSLEWDVRGLGAA